MHLIIDDCKTAAAPVSDLIGFRRFGDVLIRHTRLAQWTRQIAGSVGFDRIDHVLTETALEAAIHSATKVDAPAMLLPASIWLNDCDETRNLMRRVRTGNLDVILQVGGQIVLFGRNGRSLAALRNGFDPKPATIQTDGEMLDLDDYQNALSLLSNVFDSRHFNSLQVDTIEVIKRSQDKLKMRAEHDLWGLLPDPLKRWFVRPYGYSENGQEAEYRMERHQVADLGIQWAHGALSVSDLDDALRLLSGFLRDRPIRQPPDAACKLSSQFLYVRKVRDRLGSLDASIAARLDRWLAAGTQYSSLEDLLRHYLEVRTRVQKIVAYDEAEAISHGDLCFSNILYDRHARFLKLIDPRGASHASDLWMDSGYDWAKLSHSVLGDYDFINHGQFRLFVDSNDRLKLLILAQDTELHLHKQHFIEWLNRQGKHVLQVRIDEVSLFLSMLPLHVDHPHKVLAFLINAAGILNEIECNLDAPNSHHH